MDGDLCFLPGFRRMPIETTGKLDGHDPVVRVFRIADTLLLLNGDVSQFQRFLARHPLCNHGDSISVTAVQADGNRVPMGIEALGLGQ